MTERLQERNYRKAAPAVPVSQGACKVFAPFILGMNLITWPQYLQEVKISMWFFQATLATSYFEICLAPHIIFLLNSTLDSCSFILLPPKFCFFQLQVLLFLPVNNSPPHTHIFTLSAASSHFPPSNLPSWLDKVTTSTGNQSLKKERSLWKSIFPLLKHRAFVKSV